MSRDSYVNNLSPVIPSLAWPAAGLFLDFVQWAEPVRVEPTLRKGRHTAEWIYQSNEANAELAERPVGARANFHVADDTGGVPFGERDIKLGDFLGKLAVHSHNSLSNDPAFILPADACRAQAWNEPPLSLFCIV
jgi:hypothetical protein